MIISKLLGGLGNQMFQYAAGRRLSHILGTRLKLDISGFETYSLRKYGLNIFKIHENLASEKDVSALVYCKKKGIKKLWAKFLPMGRESEYAPTYIREKHFHFDPTVLKLPDGVYLDGYWQSEKYFIDIEPVVRKEFTFMTPQSSENLELAEQMSSCESISMHIRRGDYVNDEEKRQFHGAPDLQYYRSAVGYFTKLLPHACFFVFSDEPSWVSENIHLEMPMKIVRNNRGNKDYEDLRLMSQCKHHIIANSSFSWWGAWLNPNPEKIVVAPRRWFKVDGLDTTDLIPDGWIKI